MDIKLTSSGDLDLYTGQIETVTGADETAQRLRIKFGFVKGEWFLDVTEGVPYRERIFRKGVTKRDILPIYRKIIITDPGIVSLNSIDILIGKDRRAEIVFEAVAVDGSTLSSKSFGPFILGSFLP